LTKEIKKPNFMGIGSAKCGTTSLFYYLRQHPDIYLPLEKELNFFNNDNNYCQGFTGYLNQYFTKAEKFKARGEITPSYFDNPEKVIPRLKENFESGELKFILLLRNPVERAFSHYLHMVCHQNESESFEDALSLENARLKQNLNKGYFTDGLYAEKLEHWLTAFGRKQFFILLTHELAEDANNQLKLLFQFLGIDDNVQIDTSTRQCVASTPRSKWLMNIMNNPDQSMFRKLIKLFIPSPTMRSRIRAWIQVNQFNRKPMADYPKVDSNTRQRLRIAYLEDIERLEQLIEKDLSSWK
jgi:hypothetical protein